MFIPSFEQYVNSIGNMVQDKMYLKYLNDPTSPYVRFNFADLNWHCMVKKEEFQSLYDLCSSVEYGYYCARSIITQEFTKVLFKKNEYSL